MFLDCTCLFSQNVFCQEDDDFSVNSKTQNRDEDRWEVGLECFSNHLVVYRWVLEVKLRSPGLVARSPTYWAIPPAVVQLQWASRAVDSLSFPVLLSVSAGAWLVLPLAAAPRNAVLWNVVMWSLDCSHIPTCAHQVEWILGGRGGREGGEREALIEEKGDVAYIVLYEMLSCVRHESRRGWSVVGRGLS